MTPKLNISHSKKNLEWGEQVMKYFVGHGVLTPAIKSEMEVLYKLSSGYFDEKDYNYVLNPYGEEQRKRPELQGDPAKLRNYDIISPVVNAYIGDYISRGTKFQAVNPSYDIAEERRKEEMRLMKENLMAQFRQALSEENGVDLGLDNTQMSQEEIQQKVEKLPDTDSIEGQKSLDYIRYFNECDRKYRLAFYDYITIGRMFTYRDAYKDETYFDIINPIDFNYVASPDCVFIENAEAAWVEYKYTGSEVIDRFSDILPKEAMDYIESNYGEVSSDMSTTSIGLATNDYSMEAYDSLLESLGGRTNPVSSGFTIIHLTFKARRKLGKLIQYGYDGSEAGYIEVDEDFLPRVDETVKWEYVNETWEIYSLDDKYYFGLKVLPLQRGTLGSDKAKLPYNGRTFGNRTSLPYTPVKKGKYFQELHNVVKYRVERTMAKNKDKIIPFPIGAINDSKKDMFSTMYYSDYHGYLFFDETNAKATQALSSVRPIDASLTQYIKAMYDISYAIRQEYYESLGLPRQKLADIKASDDVGNTQEAINRGNLLTEDLMMSFEEVQEKDYQCLIDMSKYVWVDGKKGMFLNSDGRLDSLSLDGEAYAKTPHTVFIKGTKEERRKLEKLREQIQPLAQNGYGPTALGEIIESNNFEDLMQKLDFYERKLSQDQQQANQAKIQSDERIKAEENALEREKMDREDVNKQADRDNDIRLQLLKNQGALASIILAPDTEGNVPDSANELLANTSKDLADINLKREELIEKAKDRKSAEKIAVVNKNRYDTKSTAKA